MYSYGPPHMAVQNQDDQHEHTFSSYVRIRDAVLKTYLGRWTIGRSGERGSWISVLPARYDDDESFQRLWFFCTPLNGTKYCYVSLTIPFDSHLVTHSLNGYRILFDPLRGPYKVLPLRVRMDLGVMAMKW